MNRKARGNHDLCIKKMQKSPGEEEKPELRCVNLTFGGHGRIRTAVEGFADPCLSHSAT